MQNGSEMDDTAHSDEFNFLVEYGISKLVAGELEKIYTTGKLSHSELDERALDALKEFNPDDAIKVLEQFNEASLEHVTNKSAFLCGQMKTYRQKSKSGGANAAPKGPDPDKIKEILDKSGYTLDVTTGQRKYGGPPPDWGDGPQPGPGHEVFIGKIPKDVFEDELIPLVEECGRVWDLRLMMDPMTGFNRGYAFCTYVDKKDAKTCVEKELLKSISDVADNQYGRKVLLYLLSPRDPHHFHPDIVRVLQEGDNSATSKKDKTQRYKELLGVVSEPLLQYIAENVDKLVVNNNMLLLVLAILTHAQGDPTVAMEAVANIAAQPFVVGNTNGKLHIIENPAGHMTLKRLIQNDKQRVTSGQTVLFSEILLKKLPDGAVKSWAACNRGCFTLICLFELDHSEITKTLTSSLKGVRSSLKKMTFKGAQVLAMKLEEARSISV